jgi:hypothetical protein
MAIPTIKWDGKGLQLDKYFMEHQIPRPANEGWVTIGGRHVLIGGEDHAELKNIVTRLNAGENLWGRVGIGSSVSAETTAFARGVDAITGENKDNGYLVAKTSEVLNIKGSDEASKFANNPEVVKQAQALNTSVRLAEPSDKSLYRGLGSIDPIAKWENIKQGDLLDIAGVKHFSTSQTTAEGFARGLGGGMKHMYVLETNGPVKGVNVASLSGSDESEVITQGKFKVDKVSIDGIKKTMSIHQVGVF